MLGHLQVVDVDVRAVEVRVAGHSAVFLPDLGLEAEFAVSHGPHELLLAFLCLLFVRESLESVLFGLLSVDDRCRLEVLQNAVLNL